MFRGILIWLAIMAAETIHGVARGLFLVPYVGEAMASHIGWPIAVVIVFTITFGLIGWTGLRDRGSLFRLGTLWAALTLAFEIGIGLLRGLDATRIWAEINPFAGGLMLYSLLVIGLAPWLMAKCKPAR